MDKSYVLDHFKRFGWVIVPEENIAETLRILLEELKINCFKVITYNNVEWQICIY